MLDWSGIIKQKREIFGRYAITFAVNFIVKISQITVALHQRKKNKGLHRV